MYRHTQTYTGIHTQAHTSIEANTEANTDTNRHRQALAVCTQKDMKTHKHSQLTHTHI